jgi:hypothetical protein
MTTYRIILPLALVAVLAACRDTTDPEPEPDVATLRLTIGTTSPQTVTVATNPGCAVTGGPINLTVNQARAISASFLNAAGEPDPVANDPATFKLAGGEGQQNPTPTPPSIEFTRTGPFAGTLTGTAAAQGSVFLSLLHIEEGHEDWGPCSVPISVAP